MCSTGTNCEPPFLSRRRAGIGYDVGAGVGAKTQLWADWRGHIPDRMIAALEPAIGVTGERARALTARLRGQVDVPWDAAIAVFEENGPPDPSNPEADHSTTANERARKPLWCATKPESCSLNCRLRKRFRLGFSAISAGLDRLCSISQSLSLV
jgi:hypothetical protein